ncbi:HAD family hydrolase [Enterococcus sp. CSURQ0835]|uniref:HAD family hydrolase n=1 Tax=Enterococcus sp. CSURQ0835 TaxID=2681394 RepID=UPI00135AFCBA|nr:HAD family hydrolase [Enterococcus sp. CSURQ0835]
MLTAVVFDVDDTIYDQQQPFNAALKKIFPHVLATDYNSLYKNFRFYSDQNFCKVTANEWTLEQMRSYRIAQSLADLHYPVISGKMALLFQATYEQELEQIQMPEAIKRSLDFLKANDISLNIITNGPTEHQYKKIQQLNLLHWVDKEHIIVSQETGYEKPDVEIFKLAEKQFGLDPATCLYVGDNFSNDVIGSKKAGWQALWFNHRKRQTTHAGLQDIEVTEFDAIYPAFQQLFA